MNTVILMGRLTRDPEVRYSQGENAMAIARYSLAVDRPKTRNNQEPGADFINCVAFGKSGEHAEKYFRQGMRVLISGRIQTGSYTNRDGQKVYTTEVVVNSQEFADSKRTNSNGGNGGNGNGANNGNNGGGYNGAYGDQSQNYGGGYGDGGYGYGNDGGFMNIPDGVEAVGLLFN